MLLLQFYILSLNVFNLKKTLLTLSDHVVIMDLCVATVPSVATKLVATDPSVDTNLVATDPSVATNLVATDPSVATNLVATD